MAIAAYKDYERVSSERDGRVTIYLDSTDEVDDLSTDYAPGSKAIAATEDGTTTYILSPSKEWKENGNL